MDVTGHRSVAMVRVYIRRADAFADHAGAGLYSPTGLARGSFRALAPPSTQILSL
jgi:hypothetical protein